jgi:predicted HTH domain antitoxin
MPEKTLNLTLPTSLAKELCSASQDFVIDILQRGLRELKIERALERYMQGGISFGAAASLAGISRSEFSRYAYAHGLQPPFSPETLMEEIS